MALVRCPSCGVLISARFSIVVHKAHCTLEGVVKEEPKKKKEVKDGVSRT